MSLHHIISLQPATVNFCCCYLVSQGCLQHSAVIRKIIGVVLTSKYRNLECRQTDPVGFTGFCDRLGRVLFANRSGVNASSVLRVLDQHSPPDLATPACLGRIDLRRCKSPPRLTPLRESLSNADMAAFCATSSAGVRPAQLPQSKSAPRSSTAGA